MLYHMYEWQHAAVAPLRNVTHATKALLDNPFNPFAATMTGRMTRAACELFERVSRRYGKPAFGLDQTEIDGEPVHVVEEVAYSKPFCDLRHFRRLFESGPRATRAVGDPRVLIVAPMSGHYATLLRGTVAAMLPEHDVYITDWRDARLVPLREGRFDLDDYTDYIIEFLRYLGPDVHVMSVCQPGPAVLGAVALMAANDDDCQPATMTFMGSPIDTRRSPTAPNQLATQRSLSWFERNVIYRVPFPHQGAFRRVYPGFLQLTGFMTMNLQRHLDAHADLFRHLIKGDGDSAEAHRKFYDEYLSVMDLTAEFYLQTIRDVFQKHALAKGEMHHRGRLIETAAIHKTALMTVEGEKDDISGIGQTQAAHDLCVNIPESRQADYVQPGVGHYGVFNGSRFRREIQPRIRDFMRAHPTARSIQ